MRLPHAKSYIAITMASLIATSTFAQSTQKDSLIIQNAKSHEYYLKLGSFVIKENADRLLAVTQSKTHYPVTETHYKKYYIIKVGPMPTAQEAINVQAALLAPVNQHIAIKTAKFVPNEPVKNEPIVNDAPPVIPSNTNGKAFIGAYVGVQRPSTNNHSTVNNGSGYPSPLNVDRYSRTFNTSADAAVEAGYRKYRDQFFIPEYAVSLRYQHTFATDIGNQVMQYSLPEFTNYNYTWDIASDILLAMAKVNLISWHHIMPYISGGAGITFNRATNYAEKALSGVTARYSPGYTNITTTRFAYDLGAGFDFQVMPQLLMTLGYDFQSLGNVPSGEGVATWSGTRLMANHYHSNSVMLGFNYLFNLPA